MDEALLTGIDAADADLPDPARVDRTHRAADLDQGLLPVSAQAGDRHAMYVAARRQRVRIEVSMGVQPQNAQALALLPAMTCDGTDAADRQAVVTSEQQWQSTRRKLGMHGLVHEPVPGDDFAQVTVPVDWRQPGIGRAAEVAAIDDFEAVPLEHRRDLRHAQRLRPHARAPHAGAN